MNRVKKGLDNQAIGLLSLLLFMLLDSYLSYLLSLIIGVTSCFVCTFLLQALSKDKVYQFMPLPSAGTLVLYSVFLCLELGPVLFIYSPLITEVLLIVALTIVGFTRRTVIQRIRDSKRPSFERALLRITLNEFYFLAQLVQNLYTLHLFITLLYSILSETMQNMCTERFLYRKLGLVIGALVTVYEQIRLSLMQGSLGKEMWVPVSNDNGKAIGCTARSVSRFLPKKYYHPTVRIAAVYNGMLYLVRRNKDESVSPDTMDCPFHNYVLFRHSIDNTVREILGSLAQDKSIVLRFLVRYTSENEKVKHLVSLYVTCLRMEEQLNQCKRRSGKFRTAKQIEENSSSGVSSEYLEKEFAYSQNTILFVEGFCCGN